jgi:hypothetical protein
MVLRFALPLLIGMNLLAQEEKVTLPLSEYLKLRQQVEKVAAMPAPVADPPATAVREAVYILTPARELLRVDAEFAIEVTGGPSDTLFLPIPGSLISVAEKEDKPCGLEGEDKSILFIAPSPGTYHVKAAGVVKMRMEEGRLLQTLHTPSASKIMLDLDIDRSWKYSLPGSIERERTDAAVRLALPAGQELTLTLEPQVRQEAAKAEFWAETSTFLLPQGGGVLAMSFIQVHILDGTVGRLTLAFDPSFTPERLIFKDNILRAQAEGGTLAVNLPKATTLFVVQGRTAAGTFLPPKVREARTQQDFAAFSPTGLASFTVEGQEDWARVDASELPKAVTASYPFPVHLAHQRKGTKTLRFAEVAYAPVSPVRTLILSREVKRVLLATGPELHYESLQIQNPGIEAAVPVPEGFTLWSLRVDGASKNGLESAGKVIVPIGVRDETRPARIEALFQRKGSEWAKAGQVDLRLPVPDLPVVRENVSLILPEQYRYRLLDANGSASTEPMVVLPVRADYDAPRSWYEPPPKPAPPPAAPVSISASGTGGALTGVVTDNQNAPLPGATVIAESPALKGGSRSVLTDASGQFSFANLPAGEYTLTTQMEGFQLVKNEKIRVVSDRTTKMLARLQATQEFQETVVVTGQAPVVDVTSTTTGDTYLVDGIDALGGRGRSYQAALPKPTKVEVAPSTNREVQAIQSLVSGVKALPIQIPERGKIYYFERVLPQATPFSASIKFEKPRKKILGLF